MVWKLEKYGDQLANLEKLLERINVKVLGFTLDLKSSKFNLDKILYKSSSF